MIAGFAGLCLSRCAPGIPLFAQDMVGKRSSVLQGDAQKSSSALGAGRVARRCARATRIGEFFIRAAPDGIASTGWRVAGSRHAAIRSPARNACMRANAVRFAAGLALAPFAAPLPATAQYFPPVMIIVPPAAQNYATPKAAPKPAPDKPKPAADTASPTKPAGHYQGQTFVPD
jgi:hypothetical protein